MIFYRFARAVVLGLCKVVFRVRVVGTENVPTTGAYIVAPTHRSNLDTPFSAFVTKRPIRFMAKQELFQQPLGAKLFTALGGVPRRARLTEAPRAALEGDAARARGRRAGRGVPRGHAPARARGHGTCSTATAYLAVKLGVPIVPVGIGGSEEILPKGKKLPRLHRVAVVVGQPIVPPVLEGRARRAAATKLTDELATELQRVFTEALRIAG